MDYLILKYFVGSIYDGGADEYIPLQVPDKDAFLIFLLDKLDSACKELNEDPETRYLNLSKYDLSVNGVGLPLSNFNFCLLYFFSKVAWLFTANFSLNCVFSLIADK